MLMMALTLWIGAYPLGSLVEGWVVCQLLVISYGAQWLSHNGTSVTNDADYLKAVVKVKKAMLAWAVLLLIQVAAYLIINGVPDWNAILDLIVVE